jgi:hypothetical protein
MAAKHKYQNARLKVRSSLPPEKLVTLAVAAGEGAANKIPGGSKVVVVESFPMSATFSVKSLGGMSEQMRFRFSVLTDNGTTTGSSEITSFRTSQQKVMMVPVAPKSLQGWSQYRKFCESLSAAIRSADPSAPWLSPPGPARSGPRSCWSLGSCASSSLP